MSQALGRTYDGIIIGAGHHGLVLGSYLAKAGLDILLVDRRLTYGGGLNTTEATAPGFYHNLHSINHFHISETPWFHDLALASRVTYITPRYEFGQAHRDGTALVLGRDLEETVANIARLSPKDAATFREWNRKAEEMTARILIPERYAEPLPQAERDGLLERTALGREFLGIALPDGRTVRARQFVASTIDVHQTFEDLVGRDQIPAALGAKLDNFQYTKWALFGLHLALHESPRFAAEKFDPNINRALKWSIGAETMEDLFAAHQQVMAGKMPDIVQFGSGPLSLLDPTQAPPGKHTSYAWHVMPLDPDIGEQDYESWKAEFSEKILDTWARYCPNMTKRNIIAQYAYTGREYVQELVNMRGGDIFMGAFNAEQVMYNHFGYRTPIPNLYYAGSAP